MSSKHVAIIGAGIGGLATAIELAVQGMRVTVLERAAGPGGKLRAVAVGTQTIDAAGMLTMRRVFDSLFDRAGTSLGQHLVLTQATLTGRHAWAGDRTLDLFADPARTADAIGDLAGSRNAAGYRVFQKRARRMFEMLETRFLQAPQPEGSDLLFSLGPINAFRLKPFQTLWAAVAAHMSDARLHQVFGRISSQYGTSPFQAPAAMMLLAHAEQSDSWVVQGGIQALIDALTALAERHGVTFRFDAAVREVMIEHGSAVGVQLDSGELVRADAVVMNGDPAALATGLLGSKARKASSATRFAQRSLSAGTWAVMAEAEGLPLVRQTVFFSRDTKLEFDLIQSGRLPTEPTISLQAQDRPAAEAPAPAGPERMLLSVNAPASGDRRAFSQVEIDQCMQGMTSLLKRCGLTLRLAEPPVMATPATYHRQFPATAGALYGPAIIGIGGALRRSGARTKVGGLYLAGGSTHPGPGMAAAALSGRQAALCVVKDLTPKSRWLRR